MKILKMKKKLEKEWNKWIKINKTSFVDFIQNTLENKEIFTIEEIKF